MESVNDWTGRESQEGAYRACEFCGCEMLGREQT